MDGYFLIVKYADSGLTAKQVGVWSEYYFYDMPAVVSYTIDDLKPDTAYTIDVYPEGFFYNRGKPIHGTFRTK